MKNQLSPIHFTSFGVKARFVQIDKKFILEFEDGQLSSFDLDEGETVLEAIDRFKVLNAGCACAAFAAAALKLNDCEIDFEGQKFRACNYAPKKGYICNGTNSFLIVFSFQKNKFWEALSDLGDDCQRDEEAFLILRQLVAEQLGQAQA